MIIKWDKLLSHIYDDFIRGAIDEQFIAELLWEAGISIDGISQMLDLLFKHKNEIEKEEEKGNE